MACINGKIWISCIDKVLLSDEGKKYCWSKAIISVIQTLLHQKQCLRGGMLTLNAVVYSIFFAYDLQIQDFCWSSQFSNNATDFWLGWKLGHFRISILSSASHSFIDFAVCLGSSCRKIQSGGSSRFSVKIIKFASKIFLYTVIFILPSITDMLPLSFTKNISKLWCCHLQISLLELYSFLHPCFQESLPNNSILVLSVHNTLSLFFSLSLSPQTNFNLASMSFQ